MLPACEPNPADPDPDSEILTDSGGDSGGTDSAPDPGTPCSEIANLELVPLDVWGRDLDGATLSTADLGTPVTDADAGPGVVLYPLSTHALTIDVSISAADHLALSSSLSWDGESLEVGSADVGQVAWSHDTRTIDGRECPVVTAYFGVEHAWFSPSADPPTRNDISLHLDGKGYWEDVADVMAATDTRITWATWYWESDFELMNTKSTDWDTVDHLVYDERRMYFDSDEDARADVMAGLELPDLGPRKDYGMRIDGPAAADVEELIASRWNTAIDDGELYSENATELVTDAPSAEPDDGVMVQVVATMPEPWAEMAIGETHGRAFQQASHYIYIEDQYFRAPMMNDLIIDRMYAEPDLVLIVITKDVSDWDGGAEYTWESDATFRDLFPDRYLLLQLRSVALLTDPDAWFTEAEVVTSDIDTHSKIRLVDDTYLSVGSCNFNNRGYLYEGEMDVAVLDEDFTTRAREAIFASLVGSEWEGLLSDDPVNNLDVLRSAAEENQARLDWWNDHAEDMYADEASELWTTYAPSGFVYPLEISDEWVWDVGPDAF